MTDRTTGDVAERAPTMASRLRSARAARFVGRRAELELFQQALDDPTGDLAVLFVHGPPGVGKSALLRELAARARDRARQVVLVDVRNVEHTPAGLLEVLDPGEGRGLEQIDVLLLDTYELASALDGWVRDQLLPALRADCLVVIAGRRPPSTGWTADPGWRPLVRVVALRNLRREDAAELLAVEDVGPAEREHILDQTFGHPLALGLYLDLLEQRRQAPTRLPEHGLLDAPDVVHSLLERFVDEVPTRAHRAALELCAHVRVTSEDLVRVALDLPPDEAAGLFEWLRGLSFVEATPEGLFPHDLARDLLDADRRWRDAAGYDALHLRVRRHFVERVRSSSGRDRHRAAADLVFLHRANPLMRRFWDFNGLSQGYLDRLRDDDAERLREMARRHEGDASAAVLDRWLERQPSAFAVVRLGADPEPVGFTALLDLRAATEEDLQADPAAAAMWEEARRRGGTASGDAVVACRYVVDGQEHQAPGTLTFGLTSVHHLQHMLTQPHRAVDFIGGIAHPEQLDPVFSYIDFVRAPSVEYDLGGRRWSVFVRDWRRLGVDAWFEMVADRELGAPVEPVGAEEEPTAIALSQPDFALAVRSALRDLHRRDRLRGNPLVRSRVVRDLDRPDGAAALASALRAAVEAVGADPRAERYARAVDRTYVRAAPTQEAAAEVLDLPFSTYRRHLTRGLDLVTARLWDAELYGASGPDEQEVSIDRPGS